MPESIQKSSLRCNTFEDIEIELNKLNQEEEIKIILSSKSKRYYILFPDDEVFHGNNFEDKTIFLGMVKNYKPTLNKIYDFKKTIDWLGKSDHTTSRLASNLRRQAALYEAFFEAYFPDVEGEGYNKDYAASHMLEAYKKIILLNQKAHQILNPKIKFDSLEKQLEEFFDQNKEVADFIFKYIKL